MAAKIAVGIIGNVASISTSLAPIPTFWRICKKQTTEDFSSLPYAMCFVNNLLWGWYSLPIITHNNLLLLTICAAQVVLQIIYLTLYFIFASPKQKLRLLFIMLSISIISTFDVAMTMLAFSTPQSRRAFAGCLATAASLSAFASPMSMLGVVIRTQSVEFMPPLLSLSFLFNCLTWTLYGYLGHDIFLMVANGFGVLLSIMQLIVYVLYSRTFLRAAATSAAPNPSSKPEFGTTEEVKKVHALEQIKQVVEYRVTGLKASTCG